mmetsp:Transcript_19816/g.18862  ORF Transcript_19816/g.18862 Transcript_19816/m.18862 type:complete len:81 (+) Transcript_19816:319-561(+)
MVACKFKHLSIVKILVDSGRCNVLYKSANGTSLLTAAEGGSLDILNYLCALPGVKINDQDESGTTALYVAVFRGNLEMTK